MPYLPHDILLNQIIVNRHSSELRPLSGWALEGLLLARRAVAAVRFGVGLLLLQFGNDVVFQPVLDLLAFLVEVDLFP